jgi:hypothetical protein
MPIDYKNALSRCAGLCIFVSGILARHVPKAGSPSWLSRSFDPSVASRPELLV